MVNKKIIRDIDGNMIAKPRQRTNKQSRAMHKMFSELADELNASGMDMKAVLKPEVDIMWNKDNVKEYLWKPIQKAMYQKESTTELETHEVDKVFSVLAKHLGEITGLDIQFPSIEHYMTHCLTQILRKKL